jgi:hypothetical protein
MSREIKAEVISLDRSKATAKSRPVTRRMPLQQLLRIRVGAKRRVKFQPQVAARSKKLRKMPSLKPLLQRRKL